MKWILFLWMILLPFGSTAKEYTSLKTYQKETKNSNLQPSDWLKSDRKRNTLVWMQANRHNLTNNKPEEYVTFKQRKDFFAWLDAELKQKGHEVVWPSMACFISSKMRLLECFPYEMLTDKKMKGYAKAGSDSVFQNAFATLNDLYHSDTILKGEAALEWDKQILHEEQFIWIEKVYQNIDAHSLRHIERIAKGKSIYSLFVPKAITFEGDIAKADDRYHYALNKLYHFCKAQDR